MSEDLWNVWTLPTGRRLEGPDTPPGYVGTLGVLRPADKERVEAARRRLREIPAGELEGDGRYLVERTSGKTYEVYTALVDLHNPTDGVEAFTVRDGWFVPLRLRGAGGEAKSVALGVVGGRRLTGKDRL